ncbi:hypothetical protein ACFX13_012458 [Malus domestica]
MGEEFASQAAEFLNELEGRCTVESWSRWSEAQGWRRASVKLLVAWCHGGESATTALRRRLNTGKDKAHTRVPHRSYS